jgi:hypothetical protein
MRPVTDLQRTVAPFEVISEYTPSGDQPKAIKELTARIQAGERSIRKRRPDSVASRTTRGTTSSPTWSERSRLATARSPGTSP